MAKMKNYKTEVSEEDQVRQLVREYWDSLADERTGSEQGGYGTQRSSRRE